MADLSKKDYNNQKIDENTGLETCKDNKLKEIKQKKDKEANLSIKIFVIAVPCILLSPSMLATFIITAIATSILLEKSSNMDKLIKEEENIKSNEVKK